MVGPVSSDRTPGILKKYETKKRVEFAREVIDGAAKFIYDLSHKVNERSIAFAFVAGSICTLICLYFCGFYISAVIETVGIVIYIYRSLSKPSQQDENQSKSEKDKTVQKYKQQKIIEFTVELVLPEMDEGYFTKLKTLIKEEAIRAYIDWNSVNVKDLGNAVQVSAFQHVELTEIDLQFLKNIQRVVKSNSDLHDTRDIELRRVTNGGGHRRSSARSNITDYEETSHQGRTFKDLARFEFQTSLNDQEFEPQTSLNDQEFEPQTSLNDEGFEPQTSSNNQALEPLTSLTIMSDLHRRLH